MKKIYFIVLCSALVSVLIIFGLKNTNAEEQITRYEWIKLLCEESGFTKFDNSKSYFEDVNEQNIYFKYVQSAVEFNLINLEDEFNGNDYAKGKFVVLSAMKSIGEEKIKLALNIADDIDDKDYIDLALDYKLIKKRNLNRRISEEQCKDILREIENLCFSEFYPDNYEKVKLKEGVIELSSEEYTSIDEDITVISVSDGVVPLIGYGSILILEDGNGQKYGRKVVDFKSKNQILLDTITLEEGIEFIEISDIVEVTFDDIANFYVANSNIKKDYRFINASTLGNYEITSKGISFRVYTEESEGKNLVNITVADNGSGLEIEIPFKKTLEEIINESNPHGKKEVQELVYDDVDEEVGTKIDINYDMERILVASQLKYEYTKGVEYAEVTIDADTKFSGALIHSEKDFKISLAEIFIPLGKTGLVGINLNIFIKVSADGSFSIEAEMPMQKSIRYENNKVRYNSKEIELNDTSLEANGELKGDICAQPILTVLKEVNIIDAEISVGVGAKVTDTYHPNEQRCIDTLAYAVTSKIQVCSDDDIESIVGELGISGEWDIIEPENAFFQKNTHVEYFPDGLKQIVEECTYKEVEIEETPDVKPDIIESVQCNNKYTTRLPDVHGITSPVFSFNYPDNWEVTLETVDEDFNEGKVFAEQVVLSNGKDIEIEYCQLWTTNVGGYGHSYMERYEITKVADTEFVPSWVQAEDYSYMGKFIVAELKCVGSLELMTDTEYHLIDGESYYAIVPESYVGIVDDVMGMGGKYEKFSFKYGPNFIMWAKKKQGDFTPQEINEVVEILSSFREGLE